MSVNLFIPAAGMGSRLRPLTLQAPKPLLPIAGISLIQRIIEDICSSIEIDRIGINTHYLPEVIEEWKSASHFTEKIDLFHEELLLGTGGALKNAASLLGKKTFIVANGDVLADIDWQALLDHHRQHKNLVTLAVQDRKHERRVGSDENGKLLCIDKNCATPGVANWTGYACAAVYEAEFLDLLPEGESHVVPYWLDCNRVGVFDIGADKFWLDLGTPETFAEATLYCLQKNKRFLAEPLKTPFDTKFSGSVVLEKDVQLGRNVSLENVICLPGSRIDDDSNLKNCITGKDFIHHISWPQNVRQNNTNTIGAGGSDRQYYRCEDKVLLQYSIFERDIERQIQFTKAFLNSGVRAPKVFLHKSLKRQLLIEDLGDLTFREFAANSEKSQVQETLHDIMDKLLKLQFTEIDQCPLIKEKVLDKDVLLWETAYFLERFVMRVCGICEDFSAVNKELEALADEVNALPKVIMHRDFQSENIMIKDSKAYFIDFQGAHLGPPFYDAISILRDPYTKFAPQITQPVKEKYLKAVGQKFDMTFEQCRRAFYLCGLQRHMQALGAYGFLSEIRDRSWFAEHMTPAVEYLKLSLAALPGEFPELNKLIHRMELS